MWGTIAQLELATAIVDRTDALSLLGAGLLGFIWLAVALAAWMAVCDQRFQVPTLAAAKCWPSGRRAARAKRQLQGSIVGIMKCLSYLLVSILLFEITSVAWASPYGEECLRAVCEQVCSGSWREGTCLDPQVLSPDDPSPLDDGYPPPPEGEHTFCYQTLLPSLCPDAPLPEPEAEDSSF
jgi:hypothetical protein